MRNALEAVLREILDPAIAVSGGVDSVTLAALAAEVCEDVMVVHAASPAVPAEATDRVKALGAERGWNVLIVTAGEFADSNYVSNPVNRCFYCKTNLYATIQARTKRQILSGANLDDLGEYRPGLDAARDRRVRHPYIEAGFDKLAVRSLARELGLREIAELPASPCLSSRVETGIPIEAAMLGFIHEVEKIVAQRLLPKTIRCRVRAAAVVIEMDAQTLVQLEDAERRSLAALIASQPHSPRHLPILFQPYRNGSAFLRAAQ